MSTAKHDGGLRNLFVERLPTFHWVKVETSITGGGVPDINFCFAGMERWIECKKTTGWAIHFERFQPAWIDRRVRAGGRVYIAVRRVTPGGPRSGPPVDELWLVPGPYVWQLKKDGLKGGIQYNCWHGGPNKWDWDEISKTLLYGY